MVRSASSVIFAAQGEVIAERSGVINLGTEGAMLLGALTAFVVSAATGSAGLAVLAAAVVAAALAAVHAFLVVDRGANQLASGLGVFFLGFGLAATVGVLYGDATIAALPQLPVLLLSELPILGPVLFDHDVLTYAALLLGPAVWLFLFRTRWGLVLRATGERSEVAYAYGHSPRRVRYLAVTAGGALAGIGGAQLVLAYTLTWAQDLTAGRGFVAVALVIFAAWNPLWATVGAFVFGGALSLQLQLQARGTEISPFLLDMTPYVLTLLVLVLVAVRGRDSMPEGLRAIFGTARA